MATTLSCPTLPRFATVLILGLFLLPFQACAYDVLCRDGNTSFEAHSAGVAVDVGPPINGKLAGRSCRAILRWDDQELVVARDAAEIDLDMFGVDLGTGHLVVAFQIKKTASDCCMTYKIYSLEKPPQLLRTLHGGSSFNGADTNLNGQVEIWTDDAAVVDGFEGLRASQFQFPPTCVLRFDHDRLIDVSSEFQFYFDKEIAQLRAEIHSQDLERFKLGADKLKAPSAKADVSAPLLVVKEEILQLVWAYLYSNREKQAWQTLADMWPPADVTRIRSAIVGMRTRGIWAQLDSVSAAVPLLETDIQHSKTYDSTSKAARPIMVRFYSSPEVGILRGKLRVDLMIDCAGKVWSVKVSGRNKAAFDSVKRSTSNWKFIPALVDDHPVASRLRMSISVEQ